MSDYVKNTDDWLNRIVECPWCGNPVRDGDRIWLDGDCLCPDCYQHKRHKYYDKESDS